MRSRFSMRWAALVVVAMLLAPTALLCAVTQPATHDCCGSQPAPNDPAPTSTSCCTVSVPPALQSFSPVTSVIAVISHATAHYPPELLRGAVAAVQPDALSPSPPGCRSVLRI